MCRSDLQLEQVCAELSDNLGHLIAFPYASTIFADGRSSVIIGFRQCSSYDFTDVGQKLHGDQDQ